jgi:hypothetical protein
VTDRLDPGGGGLTGVTGDLTPDESEDAFVPGERREVEDPQGRARVTLGHRASAPTADEVADNPPVSEDEDRF